MSKYKVSVVIPCYNVERFIDNCMECLKRQTLKEFEVICVDDGSSDSTLRMLTKYKLGGVKIIHTENQGVSSARNEGIRAAQGDYIYFYDPDDTLAPETLETVYAKAVETESDAVQFNFQTIRENGKITNGQNGNKRTGVYCDDEIMSVFMPRFIGYSVRDISNYGSSKFVEGKEMGAVWRFLYRRSVIIDNNIFSRQTSILVRTLSSTAAFSVTQRESAILIMSFIHIFLKTAELCYSH